MPTVSPPLRHARATRLAAGILFLLLPCSAMPAHIDSITVTHQGKRYEVVMQARMDTVAHAAYAVFTDYAALPRINPAVTLAQPIAGAPPGQQRLHTHVRVCIAGLCKTFVQVQDMSAQPPEHLQATVIPELSNLRYGLARWRIWDENGQAHLHFAAEIEPDFWVPPLLGPWLIRRKLQQEAAETAGGIERLALEWLSATVPTPTP